MASWLKLSRALYIRVSCATLPVWFSLTADLRVWSRIPKDVSRMPRGRWSGLAGSQAFECLGLIHVIRWEKMVPPVSCGRWFGWWNDALEGRNLREKKVFSSPTMKNQWSVSNAWWLFKRPISEWIWKVKTDLTWLVGHSVLGVVGYSIIKPPSWDVSNSILG